jgi:hypothetical protein
MLCLQGKAGMRFIMMIIFIDTEPQDLKYRQTQNGTVPYRTVWKIRLSRRKAQPQLARTTFLSGFLLNFSNNGGKKGRELYLLVRLSEFEGKGGGKCNVLFPPAVLE